MIGNANMSIGARVIVQKMISDLSSDITTKPSGFIKKYWQKYRTDYPSNQNINGKVFEELISIVLIKEQIYPFYMQAKVAFIPNINYDFIIYTKERGPIALSAKTSLRERWKQADLEALALKNIHRKSQTHVVTLDNQAVKSRRIDDDQTLGIDSFILANTTEIDDLIMQLRTHTIIKSPTVQVVTSNTVITEVNFEKYQSK